MALGDVNTNVAGGEECVHTCCPENNCDFNDSTVCLTISTDGAHFFGEPDKALFFELNDDNPIFARVRGQVIVNTSFNPLTPTEVGMFSPAPISSYLIGMGPQMVIMLSGQYDFEDGTTYCYRYVIPFYINCILDTDDVLKYKLVVIHPKDVLTVTTNFFGDCDYVTMRDFYNWGDYFVDGFGTHFEPAPQGSISNPDVPPCDGSEIGGHWVYGFSDIALHASTAGVIASGDFNGCSPVCAASAGNSTGGEHEFGPFFPQLGYIPRTVAGPLVAITDPMDLEVEIPTDWFDLYCGSEPHDPPTANLLDFPAFTLKLHIATSEEGDDCPEDVLTGGCYATVNEIENYCPGHTTTSSTSSTSTSSTSSTSTTSTSSTSTTSTSSTTTTTTEPPPDDTRPECCPAGPFFPQIEVAIFVEPAGAGEACEGCAKTVPAAWFSAENAYIANFFSCGAGFTYPMQVRVYCIPGETEGTGQWYFELYCGGALMASNFLSNQSPNGLCDTEPPATMSGNDFSVTSTPCCATATIVNVVARGIFVGGPF